MGKSSNGAFRSGGGFQPSRRVALGLGASAAALGLAACVTDAQGAPPQQASAANTVDVVIVGAGFAGLTAARQLRAAGRSVVVLEADRRVGGRTKAGKILGETVDLGGQWVSPSHTRLLALAKEMGVATHEQYATGDNIFDVAGQRVLFKGETPKLDPVAMAEFFGIVLKIEQLAKEIPVPRSWEWRSAAEYDAQTIETWLTANARTEAVRSSFRILIRTLCCAEPSQVSMLTLLAFAAAAGGFSPMITTRGGAQDATFEGGVWQLAEKMAAELGVAVQLDAQVLSIAQDEAGVTVRTTRGVWRGKQVVMTAPPPLASRIDYTPPLPAMRDGLTQRMAMGSVIKAHIAYAKPFWREQGMTGMVLSDRTEFGPWFDHSPSNGSGGSLVGFFLGGSAQHWADRTPEERRAQALKDVAAYLGPAALTAVDYIEEVWANAPMQRGGYNALPAPGVLTHFGPALLEPVGRIHWAGTETSDAWAGYIEGAIRSGERVAREVSAKL